jgi:dephospho-CoA kinase
MKLYGLTGGIGMGKSTAGWLLAERGVSVVDTDAIAHQLAEPGQPALEEIAQRFGRDIIGADGRLRRDELARRVFGDATARKELEAILHPRIRSVWQATTDKWRAEAKAHGVVIIPLLFETAAAAAFDAVICIACSAASQTERLKARGWDERQIQQRIEAQWPATKKMELANYVVWTEGGVDVHAAQLDRILS